MIIQYVRDENNNPIGTVVATAKNKVGVSQCNSKDKFQKKIGIRIAAGRAIENRPLAYVVTRDKRDLFRPVVEKIIERSRKYFK